MYQIYGSKSAKLALTAAFLVALSISPLFAFSFTSAAASASITLSPSSASAGTTISVTGTGFQTSSNLQIDFNNAAVATTTTDSSGAFSTTFKIPAGTTAGSYTVLAESCCSGGTVTATATLTVTGSSSKGAKLVLRPFTVVAGKSDKVTGTHFTDSSSVSVTFNSATVITTTTNSTGGFVENFTVPATTAAGSYTVTATDALGVTASNTLTVTTTSMKLTMKVTATAHRDGATVTVTGNNFLASHTVTVTFNDNTVGTATTNSSGGFTLTFVVAGVPEGTYDIVGTDGTNTVTKTFGVNPYITVTPTSGAPGSTLTVNGTGFAADSQVTIALSTTTLTTATSSSTGSFQVTVSIPTTFSRGGETMTATDALGNSAKAHVRVT